MTATIKVYSLPQVVNLTLAPTGGTLMNYPVNRSDFTVTKGVVTEIHFFIKNIDRAAVQLTGAPKIIITTGKHDHLVLEKDLTVVDAAKAIWMLRLTPLEVMSFPMGTLRWQVLYDRSGDKILLYTDRGYTQQGVLEVVESPYPDPKPATEIAKETFYYVDGKLYTGSFSGGAADAIPNTLHAATLCATDFVGHITLQASLEAQPSSNDTDWFSAADLDVLTPTSGPIYIDATGSYLWVRFVVTLVDGDFTSLVYQN